MKVEKLKVFVLSLGLVLGVMTPVIAQAQTGGGMLGFGSGYYNSDRLPVGEYWSNKIDSDKPYQAWCLYIDDPTYGYNPDDPEGSLEHICVTSGAPTGSSTVGFIRNEGCPVRTVRDNK